MNNYVTVNSRLFGKHCSLLALETNYNTLKTIRIKVWQIFFIFNCGFTINIAYLIWLFDVWTCKKKKIPETRTSELKLVFPEAPRTEFAVTPQLAALWSNRRSLLHVSDSGKLSDGVYVIWLTCPPWLKPCFRRPSGGRRSMSVSERLCPCAGAQRRISASSEQKSSVTES